MARTNAGASNGVSTPQANATSASPVSATSPAWSAASGPSWATASSTTTASSAGSRCPGARTTQIGPSPMPSRTTATACSTAVRPCQSRSALASPIRLDRPPARTTAPARRSAIAARLHVLEAEAALDTEVPARDVVVVGARDLDDRVVLHVELQVAADAAVRAHRRRHDLVVLAPVVVLPQLVLRAEHQRP